MSKGKFGAYRQLTPPNSDLSRTIVQQEQLNNQYEYRKGVEKRRKADENQKNAEELSKITSPVETGYENVDAAYLDAYTRENGLKDQFAEARRAYIESNYEDANAYGKMQNIFKITNDLASMQKSYTSIQNKLLTGIAEGKISKSLNKNYVSNMEAIEKGKIYVDTSDLSNVQIKNLGGVDFDGDKLPDTINMQTFADPNNFGIWEADFNINDYSQNVLDEEFQTFEKVTDNGVTKRTLKGFNPSNKLLLKDNLKQKLGKDVNSLTNAGRSYLLKNGISLNELSPEIYETLINDTTEKYIRTRQVQDKTDVDLNALNQSEKLKLAKNKELQKAESKEKNSLRTTVDGILAGDNRFVKSLINQKLEEQGSDGKDVYIRGAEYVDGKIILKLKTGGGYETREIDVDNKKEAIAKVLKLVRPNDKPDLRIEEYDKGIVDGEFETDSKGFSVILLEKDLGDSNKSDKVIPILEENGIKGFQDTGGTWSNTIKMPNGKEVDVDTKKGMTALKEYLKKEYKNTNGKSKNESDKTPEEKARELIDKYRQK